MSSVRNLRLLATHLETLRRGRGAPEIDEAKLISAPLPSKPGGSTASDRNPLASKPFGSTAPLDPIFEKQERGGRLYTHAINLRTACASYIREIEGSFSNPLLIPTPCRLVDPNLIHALSAHQSIRAVWPWLLDAATRARTTRMSFGWLRADKKREHARLL
ncbi:hypothetical protein BX600DRAFT_149120 [Xylariales sp. PMI_506]|nr:hypothetical protein BX600DRAFT_149120 [Xylariales sp. PMI_506]